VVPLASNELFGRGLGAPAIFVIRQRENLYFEKQDWILIVDLLTAGQS
jgi:hypothetical protein